MSIRASLEITDYKILIVLAGDNLDFALVQAVFDNGHMLLDSATDCLGTHARTKAFTRARLT